MNRNTTEYRMLHFWVERQLGKPKECWHCGDKSDRAYQWANKSGQYLQDISDWERLCVPCHAKKDGWNGGGKQEYCKRGHKISENPYTRPNGTRECRLCRQIFRSKAWLTRNQTTSTITKKGKV